MEIDSEMIWAGRVACMGTTRYVYNISVVRTGGKKPVGTSRCRPEDIIKTGVSEIDCGNEALFAYCSMADSFERRSEFWFHIMWSVSLQT
jgi:hypothetical protein